MHIKGREPVASGGSKVTDCACMSVLGVCRVSRGCKHKHNVMIVKMKEWRNGGENTGAIKSGVL